MNFTLNKCLLCQQIVLLACVALAVADVSHLDTVVRFDSVVNPDSYQYAYETSKGTKAEESGVLKNAGSEQEAIVRFITEKKKCFLSEDSTIFLIQKIGSQGIILVHIT